MRNRERCAEEEAANLAALETVDRIFDPVDDYLLAALGMCSSEAACHIARLMRHAECKRSLLLDVLREETGYYSGDAERKASALRRVAARLLRRAEAIMTREGRKVRCRRVAAFWGRRSER